MYKNIVPPTVLVVIVSDVVVAVIVAGLAGPAVEASAPVVVTATNCKFSDWFNKFIKTSTSENMKSEMLDYGSNLYLHTKILHAHFMVLRWHFGSHLYMY